MKEKFKLDDFSSGMLTFRSAKWEYYLHVLLKERIRNNATCEWVDAYSSCNTVLWSQQFHRKIPLEKISWDDEWWLWKIDRGNNNNEWNKKQSNAYHVRNLKNDEWNLHALLEWN